MFKNTPLQPLGRPFRSRLALESFLHPFAGVSNAHKLKRPDSFLSCSFRRGWCDAFACQASEPNQNLLGRLGSIRSILHVVFDRAGAMPSLAKPPSHTREIDWKAGKYPKLHSCALWGGGQLSDCNDERDNSAEKPFSAERNRTQFPERERGRWTGS